IGPVLRAGIPASTPRLPSTAPGPGETFRNQNIAQAPTVTDQHAKLATISVGISAGPRFEFERTLVDQLDHPVRGTIAKSQLGRIFRLAHLRRFDIGNTDLL